MKDVLQVRAATSALHYYDRNLKRALEEVYPEYEWHPWLFTHFILEDNFWESEKNRRSYLDWLGRTHLNIQNSNSPQERPKWYSIQPGIFSFIKDNGGAYFLRYYNMSLITAIKDIYSGNTTTL